MKVSDEIVSQNGVYGKSSRAGIEFLDKVDGFSAIWRPRLNPGEFFVGSKEVAKNTDLSPYAHWAYQYILACNPANPDEMEGFNDTVAWLESSLNIAHATASKLVRELRYHGLLHKFKYRTNRGRFLWKMIFTYIPMSTAEVATMFAKVTGYRLVCYELIKDIGNKRRDVTVSLGVVANVQILDVSDQDHQSEVVANVQNLDVTGSNFRREASHSHEANINNINNNNNPNEDDDLHSHSNNREGNSFSEGISEKVRGANSSIGTTPPNAAAEWAKSFRELDGAGDRDLHLSYKFWQITGLKPQKGADQWARWLEEIRVAGDRDPNKIFGGLRDAMSKKQENGYNYKSPKSFLTFIRNYDPAANSDGAPARNGQAPKTPIFVNGQTPRRFTLKPLKEGEGPHQ